MALFGFGKKKQVEGISPAKAAAIRSIKVLGTGCKNCHTLLENTRKAAAELGLSAEVEYITDMEEILRYGVMRTPALVVNGKPVAMGRVLKAEEAAALLRKIEE